MQIVPSNKEKQAINTFAKRHKYWHIEIYPSSIGYGVNIVCDTCKAAQDITDYDTW